MNILVSIIIPVYNVESYLATCIKSILQQTYQHWEAILIDDGSTDKSSEIASSFTNTDQRIHYYKKENGGLSSARNYGIEKSQGDYIIFLDSDDFWITDDCLFKLVERINLNQLDVLRGEYIRVDEKGKKYEKNATTKRIKSEITQKVFFGSYEMMTEAVQGEYFSWLFIFKRSIFSSIRFDETRKFQEDIDFAARLFCKKLRCGYINMPFYAYRQREHSSIMTTPRLSNVYFSISLCSVFWNHSQRTEDKRLTNEYIYLGIMMYYWTLETAASNTYYNHFEEIQAEGNLIQLHKEVKNWMKKLPNRKFPIQLYVTPHNGARLYRLRWRIGKILKNLHLLK